MSENLRQDRESPRKHCVFEGFGAPAGTRTPDTLLKRHVLYLLSYWGRLAGMAGLEPTISESKSGVLPLHYIPSAVYERTGGRRPPASLMWGGIWGSNPRHPEPQSGALPTELIPPNRPRKLRIVSLPRQARKLAHFAARPPKNRPAYTGLCF